MEEGIKMKAGVVHAREDIRFEDIEKPVPKAGQVLIKVKYTGICGSDVPRVNGDATAIKYFFITIIYFISDVWTYNIKSPTICFVRDHF